MDGALTSLINHLLSMFDDGHVLKCSSKAGALFALLRNYSEICPYAKTNLINLRIITRVLNYFIAPRFQSTSPITSPMCFNESTLNWVILKIVIIIII